MRNRVVLLFGLATLLVACAVWWSRQSKTEAPPPTPAPQAKPFSATASSAQTAIYAHNLRLHQGPNFSVYVRWLRGEMARTHARVSPSFDDLESFSLVITNGVLRANLGDMSNYLNKVNQTSPLKNVVLTGDGSQIKIRGTLHKLIPLPVELIGTLSAAPGSRVKMSITKINVLKIPLKGLLGDFNVKVADLFHSGEIPGIQVNNNDILFDPQALLPPPHIVGSLTQVSIKNPDFEAVYGDASQDLQRTEEWRNFLHLTGGTINFGRLSMSPVDLIMIDISQDAWFDLDLSRYQEQLVNGYTRVTPQAGLQIFMPDLSQIPANKTNQNISIEWLKNRNLPPPSSVLEKSAK
jgi:hypothetical protein